MDEVHAFVLTGGSAYGLGCTNGVMEWLADDGIGLAAGNAVVPIVPTAVLFDLSIGDAHAYPTPDDARAACEAASSGPRYASVSTMRPAVTARPRRDTTMHPSRSRATARAGRR